MQNYQKYNESATVHRGGEVSFKGLTYPLVSVSYGDVTGPTLLVTGGVHGLERIGAELCLSLLESFHYRLQWDQVLQQMLKKIQVVFVPLANPVGYFETTRGNANGVDLMRNAPIEATDPVPFLIGGQNYSSKIHWYRGQELQTETKFLCQVVQNILLKSNCLVSLDMHSGFGFKDQLWFPFATSYKKFTQLSEMFMLFDLFEKTNPYHVYKIEQIGRAHV